MIPMSIGALVGAAIGSAIITGRVVVGRLGVPGCGLRGQRGLRGFSGPRGLHGRNFLEQLELTGSAFAGCELTTLVFGGVVRPGNFAGGSFG